MSVKGKHGVTSLWYKVFFVLFKQEWYYSHEIRDKILCLLLALEFQDTTSLGDSLHNSCLLMTGLDYFTLTMKVKILSFVSLSEKNTSSGGKGGLPLIPLLDLRFD